MQQRSFSADLARIHTIISRGLAVSMEHGYAFTRGTPAAGATSEGYQRYVKALLSIIEAHHEGEQRLAWPFLRRFIPEAPYATLIAQHDEIGEIVKAAERALAEGALDVLLVQLTELRAQWQAHIDLEEATFSATADVLHQEEHNRLLHRLANHSRQHAQPAALVIPFMLYNLSCEERAHLERALPTTVTRHLQSEAWQEAWAPMTPFFLP